MAVKSLNMLAILGVVMLGLTGCGGGGSGDTPPGNGPIQNPPPPPPPPPPPAPEIQEFAADKPEYFIGERASLAVRYTNGTGRIEPSIGQVASGAAVRTDVLDGPRELRLVVESTAHPAVARSLSLQVRYRDQYRMLDQMFSSRGHSATLVQDGTVILVGGSRGERTLSNSIDRYDPATRTFAKIGAMSTGREGHTAALLRDGRVLVSGGNSSLPTTTAEVIDPRTGAAAPTGNPRVQRSMHTATTLADGRVLIIGGQTSGEGAPLGISRTAEIWDPATGQFRMVGSPMNTPRMGHTATLLGDGRVLVVGGFSTGGDYNFVEVFNPATETFSIVASPENRERGLHSTVLLPDGSILVMGGETARAEPLSGVYRFRTDLTSERVADLLFARTLSPAVVARDGTVFLFGGEIWPGNVTTQKSEAYTPLRGGFPIAGLPQPRIGHTATRLLDGRVLIAGGETEAGQLIPTAMLYE